MLKIEASLIEMPVTSFWNLYNEPENTPDRAIESHWPLARSHQSTVAH